MNLDFEITKCCGEANKEICEQGILYTHETIKSDFLTVDISKPYSLGGGIPIGNYVENGVRKILVAPPGHTLLVGSTGSGKTEGFYLPLIEVMGRSEDNLSFVVMDMKGNMFRQKSEMLKKNGFKVIVINGKKPFASSKYNPLTVIFRAYRRAKDVEKQFLETTPYKLEFMGKKCADPVEYRFEVEQYINENMAYCHQMIDKITEIVIPIECKDPSWDYGAREIFKSMLYLMLEDSDCEVNPLREEQFTFYNVAKSISCRGADYDTLISYVRRHSEACPGRKLLNYVDSQARQTRDSYMMNVCDKLNRVVNLPMNAISSCSDIDLEEVVKSLDKEKTAIFLIADSANKAIYTLCNMFLIQLIVALQKHGDENPKGDFHILADEFCNMVPMPDIIDWITTMRSRRTWFHLGIQSYSQLEHHYSQEERYTIEGNSKTIFMGSNDFKTLEAFSQAAGLTMKVANTYSVDNNGNMSLSLSTANAPLVRISDLANMTLGEAYVKMFGPFGNKLIKTVLEPDFKIEDFAHGNAEPGINKRLAATVEENAYDISEYKRGKKMSSSDDFNPFNRATRRNWDNFFDDDSAADPFRVLSSLPRPTTVMEDRKLQTKIKGIIAKLAEKEKKFLMEVIKDRNYDEANEQLNQRMDIMDYSQRLREFGVLAYSFKPRFAFTKEEYDLFKKKLLELDGNDSNIKIRTPMHEITVELKKKDEQKNDEQKNEKATQEITAEPKKAEAPIKKDELNDFAKQASALGRMATSIRDMLAFKNMDFKNGVAELFLPFGTENVKIVINNAGGKISDGGETFKHSVSKDTIGNAAHEKSIDNMISSLGLTKRTKGKSVVLEMQFSDEKALLQSVLRMYNAICMIRQVSVLATAFPGGNS